METVYIDKERVVIHRNSEHLVLKKKGRQIGSIPLIGVKSIVLMNNCQITAQALDLIFQKNIDIIYVSKNGQVRSRLLSSRGGAAILRLSQHQSFLNYERRCEIAGRIVSGKLKNQSTLLQKYKRYSANSDLSNKIKSIDGYSQKVLNLKSIDEIMGYEGHGAKIYWSFYKDFLKNDVFEKREYRPANDYVNSSLNLAYAFLLNELSICLSAEGFDLEIGFLHSVLYGRNSLSLDIMEEFRPEFVDAWILKLVNLRVLNETHFDSMNGYYLNEQGFKKFVELYHQHLLEGNWKQKFRNQVYYLKYALLNNEDYQPYNTES